MPDCLPRYNESPRMSYIFVDEIVDVAPSPKAKHGIYALGGKRVFDLAIILVVFPIVLPVVFLAWLLMKLDGGAGFYRQHRVGKDGVGFSCWKIRTMATNADAKLLELIQSDPDLALEWETTQKLSNDPRITRIGRFLRVTSMDELPQFWNVLVGDMSLIGPRPFTPDQRQLYDSAPAARAYYLLRPGISGLWQTQSRNIGDFSERGKFDEKYAANLSFSSDIKIALETVRVVFRATGS